MRGTLSLPSMSPLPSPPRSPHVPSGPRSVSWSLPDESSYHHGSSSVSFHHLHHSAGLQRQPGPTMEDTETMDTSTPEFLAWRRLYLSKAKLQSITEMAAMMAGFSVVATVELQINDDANPYLLSAFAVTTALLVCTTMLAVMISTCILPHLETVAKMSPHSKAGDSPHDSMTLLIDLCWVLANTFSIFFFTLDVILLAWIKFTYFSEVASWCATVIMIPVLFGVLFFGIIFYRKLVQHQYLLSDRKYQELEEMKRQLDPPIINV